jgi:flagellar basal body-associated protein FliL
MAETLSHPQSAPVSGAAAPERSPSHIIGDWLPAVAILIGLPLLALAAAKYVLLPSLKEAFSKNPGASAQYLSQPDSQNLVIARLQLTGSFAVHSGFRSVTLIGSDDSLKDQVKHNKEKLEGVALDTLHGLTVADLDRVGTLDLMRTQLVAGFNKALGSSKVKEVYLTIRTP